VAVEEEEEEDEEDEEDEEAEALGRDLLLLLRCCACSSSVAIRAAVCWAAEPYKLVVLVQEKLLSKEGALLPFSAMMAF
jgi:hypothetical protein